MSSAGMPVPDGASHCVSDLYDRVVPQDLVLLSGPASTKVGAHLQQGEHEDTVDAVTV